mgnify:FL=1|jgi:hypothetical protein
MAVSYSMMNPPPWLEAFQRNQLQAGFDLTKQASPAGVPAQTITGFQPLQTGAISGIAGLYGIDPTTGLPTGTGADYDPYFTEAQQQITGALGDVGTGQTTTAMGIPSLQAAQGQYDPSTSNYQQFFNQYQADVTKEALKQIDEQAALQRNQLQDQAQQAGAFGGSRMGVQEAELDKNILDIKSRRIFQDLAQNFQQAQDKAIGTYESAAGRRLQAAPLFGQLGGAQAGLGAQKAQLGAQGAQLGAQQFTMGQAGLGSLFGLGQAQQAQQQQLENEKFRLQTERQQEPYKRLGFMGDIIQGVPSYQSTMTMKPSPYTNPLLGALGAGLGTYGILSGAEGAGSAFGLGSI